MSPGRCAAVALVGALYGGAASLLNDVSSAYGQLGGRLAGGRVQSVLQVLSVLTGAGWAWAGLAVAVGWYVRGRWSAAAAGALALTTATGAYYALDAVLRDEPLVHSDVWYWSVAGSLLGLLLGAVGARARRRDLVGALAALTVPVGAAVQMVVLPPGASGVRAAAEEVWARGLVWSLAAVSGLWIVLRSWRGRPTAAATGPAPRRTMMDR